MLNKNVRTTDGIAAQGLKYTMFGLFKTRDPEREWTLAEIKRLKGLIKGANEFTKATFSLALGVHWGIFVASQGGLSKFGSLPRDRQMDYFRKYLAFKADGGHDDPHADVAMDFIAQLLSATIMKDLAIEKDLKAFLRPYLKTSTFE